MVCWIGCREYVSVGARDETPVVVPFATTTPPIIKFHSNRGVDSAGKDTAAWTYTWAQPLARHWSGKTEGRSRLRTETKIGALVPQSYPSSGYRKRCVTWEGQRRCRIAAGVRYRVCTHARIPVSVHIHTRKAPGTVNCLYIQCCRWSLTKCCPPRSLATSSVWLVVPCSFVCTYTAF
jgi:hypothetical protein